MRITSYLLFALTAGMLFAGAAAASEEAPFHIGIMTGTLSQSEDSLRGAELMVQKYGDAGRGGMVAHVTYPDSFMSSSPRSAPSSLGFLSAETGGRAGFRAQ